LRLGVECQLGEFGETIGLVLPALLEFLHLVRHARGEFVLLVQPPEAVAGDDLILGKSGEEAFPRGRGDGLSAPFRRLCAAGERVVTGEQCAARRPAARGVVELSEAKAVLRQRIELWRVDLAAVTADGRKTEIVGKNDNDVRSCGEGQAAGEGQDGQEMGNVFYGVLRFHEVMGTIRQFPLHQRVVHPRALHAGEIPAEAVEPLR
jgi:hypothetical protein